MTSTQPISKFWFRRDLRLSDNTGLHHASKGSFPVLPIFIFDKEILNNLDDKTDARVSFIYKSVVALKKAIELHGATMQILNGYVEDTFKTLFATYNIKAIYTNRDYEPYAIDRDNRIAALAMAAGAQFFTYKDQIIFEGNEVLKQDGTPFKVFTPYMRAWLSKYSGPDQPSGFRLPDFGNFLQTSPTPELSLQSLGFEASLIEFPSAIPDENIIQQYDQTRDFPAKNGTSRLGLHLRFGTVSIRELARLAIRENNTWLNELIWREFYSSVLQHFPHVTDSVFNKKYAHISWRNDESDYALW